MGATQTLCVCVCVCVCVCDCVCVNMHDSSCYAWCCMGPSRGVEGGRGLYRSWVAHVFRRECECVILCVPVEYVCRYVQECNCRPGC